MVSERSNLAARALHGFTTEREAGEGHGLARRVLEGEHHLEERGAAHVALGLELLHQALEGHVLVGVGAEAGLAHASEERVEREIARDLGAEHQGVDEEADEPLGLGVGAPCDRRADDDVDLARGAREEDVEGREQEHEQRHALAAGELAEGARRGLERRKRR